MHRVRCFPESGEQLLLPSREEFEEEENLEGLIEEQLKTFPECGPFPDPGAALRLGPELTNDARLDADSTTS